MRHTVTVKKCKSHRIFICIFSGVMLAVITVLVLRLHMAVAMLFYIPLLAFVVPVTLYYTTWQLRFGKNKIEKKVFFRKTKSYSYGQLQEVVKGYYSSENNHCIRMHFSDGKTLQFRLDDENAAKAEKRLQKRCSFKTAS